MKKSVNFLCLILIGVLSVSFVSAIYEDSNINSATDDSLNQRIINERGESYSYIQNQWSGINPQLSQDKNEKSKGYIIEFKEEPLVKKQVELKERAKRERVDVRDELASHQQKLEQEHTNALQDIGAILNADSIRRSPPIEEETFLQKIQNFFRNLFAKKEIISYSPSEEEVQYYKVFNGIYLDITDEQAEKIKQSSYVKSVSPNIKVHTMLQDSVPLIQGGISAGQLDGDGNDCIISGKECLTGKGVKIAIIDTGVDYTHEDLGCAGEACEEEEESIFSLLSMDNNNFISSLSSYGNKIAFVRDGKVYVYDFNSNELRLVSSNDEYCAFGYVSIFESTIAYIRQYCNYYAHNSFQPKYVIYDLNTNIETEIYDADASFIGTPELSLNYFLGYLEYEIGGKKLFLYNLKDKTLTEMQDSLFGGVPFSKIYQDKIAYVYNRELYYYDMLYGTNINLDTGQLSISYILDFDESKIFFITPTPDRHIGYYDIVSNNYSLLPDQGYFPEGEYSNGFLFYIYDWTSIGGKIKAVNLVSGKNYFFGNSKTRFFSIVNENKLAIIENGELKFHIFDPSQNYPEIETNLGGFFPNSKVVGGYDFSSDDTDPMDDDGHGTHVAGIVAGNGQGGLKGVAPEAEIYAYKVFPNSYANIIISAIEGVVDPNQDGNFDDQVDIISMSLGGPGNPDDAMSQAVDNAVDSGVVVVIAAGNDGPGDQTISSPGTARKAITVGASYKKDYESFWWDCTPGIQTSCGYCNSEGKVFCNYWNDGNSSTDQITSFSSRGNVVWEDNSGNSQILIKPDIVAPGALICAARYDSIFPQGKHPYYYPCLDDKHVQMAGTSMATPIVSGAVALIKQAHPDWSPEEIKASLKATAIDLGYDVNIQGAGRLELNKALKFQPSNCNNGACILPCAPKTCTELGKTCGTWDDECGGSLNCGAETKSCNVDFGINGVSCFGEGTQNCVNGNYETTCNNAVNPKDAFCIGKQCGDDGCGGVCGTCTDTQDCSATGLCLNKLRIFVTSSSYKGNLGGISGADAKCNSDKAKPAGTKTWKALVADPNRKVGGSAWVLKPNTKYYRADSITLIGKTNANAWFTFPLNNPLSVSMGLIWTGFSNSKGIFDSRYNCKNWASNSKSNIAYVGRMRVIDSTSIYYTGYSCFSSYKLSCVEQP